MKYRSFDNTKDNSRASAADTRLSRSHVSRDSKFVIPARTYQSPLGTGGRDSAREGFTLIEMIVSVALFSFVLLAASDVLLAIVGANHKVQGMKTTLNNLSLTFETMVRDLRTGKSYHNLAFDNGNCPMIGTIQGKIGITYTDPTGTHMAYKLDSSSGAIDISNDGGATYFAVTAPEVTIDRFCFFMAGADPTDYIQPSVLITLGGLVNSSTAAGSRQRTASRFDLQTFISQRFLDAPRN